MPDGSNTGGIAAVRLRSIVERVERLEEEIKALREDVKDVLAEARSAGFDVRTIRAIVKERRLKAAEREEREALLQLYRAALGMLDGTPLGEAATRRLMAKPEPPAPEEDPGPPLPLGPVDGAAEAAEAAAPAAPTAEDIADARQQGVDAARGGKPVLANPFAAGDARRAAWDEGWCSAAGSDGMDIPAAFRRTKPKKGKPGGEG